MSDKALFLVEWNKGILFSWKGKTSSFKCLHWSKVVLCLTHIKHTWQNTEAEGCGGGEVLFMNNWLLAINYQLISQLWPENVSTGLGRCCAGWSIVCWLLRAHLQQESPGDSIGRGMLHLHFGLVCFRPAYSSRPDHLDFCSYNHPVGVISPKTTTDQEKNPHTHEEEENPAHWLARTKTSSLWFSG